MLDHSPFWLAKSHDILKKKESHEKIPIWDGAQAQRCHQGRPKIAAELCEPAFNTLNLEYKWDLVGGLNHLETY